MENVGVSVNTSTPSSVEIGKDIVSKIVTDFCAENNVQLVSKESQKSFVIEEVVKAVSNILIDDYNYESVKFTTEEFEEFNNELYNFFVKKGLLELSAILKNVVKINDGGSDICKFAEEMVEAIILKRKQLYMVNVRVVKFATVFVSAPTEESATDFVENNMKFEDFDGFYDNCDDFFEVDEVNESSEPIKYADYNVD